MLCVDFLEHPIHIVCHPAGITTDIEVRALLQPRPYLRAFLLHAILHVDLVLLIPREGNVESRKRAIKQPGFDFVAIKKILFAALIAEEKPVLSACAGCNTILEKGAERR